MGIDMGSTACKVVIIDDHDHIVEKVVSQIQVDPISTIRNALHEVDSSKYSIKRVGVTGSARNLVAKCLKTSFTKSEIIAHTFAALNRNMEIKTIIEIGGQDSKFISISEGVISEFKMNSVCAAGTGSFLQWQAERMGVTIEEFDELATQADKELDINGRCTVFIESSVVNLQRRGESRENIAYAICLCLARNYLNEICKSENIHDLISFQGGVAKLKGMTRAFESILSKNMLVDEYCQVYGALGVAMLVRRADDVNDIEVGFSKANGMCISNYRSESFMCEDCNRKCNLVRYIDQNNDTEFVVGGRCGKY